LVKSY